MIFHRTRLVYYLWLFTPTVYVEVEVVNEGVRFDELRDETDVDLSNVNIPYGT
jgi:hypothetical protein